MSIELFVLAVATALFSVDAVSIDHDKVGPFPQPQPASDSQKTVKPQLRIDAGCVPFPAVNAAGETSGGLKGSGGGLKDASFLHWAPKCTGEQNGTTTFGSQCTLGTSRRTASPFWRHYWSSAVVWIDNPALENPKVLGLSLLTSSTKYDKLASASFINGTTPVLMRYTPGFSSAKLQTVDVSAGDFQDLIMWEQLTEEARSALNDKENFGRADE